MNKGALTNLNLTIEKNNTCNIIAQVQKVISLNKVRFTSSLRIKTNSESLHSAFGEEGLFFVQIEENNVESLET